jgi:hypothetical protein
MTGAYAYTPDIWLPLAGAIFLTAIGLFCWRRRDVPGALPLLAVSLFGALWLLGIALEAAAVAPATKITWFRFQALWRAPTVTAGLCFVLEYAYPGRWLTRRNLILLSIPVLLDILLVIAGDAQLIWRRIEVGPDGSVTANLAPAGLILTVYGIGLVLVNTAVLLWLFNCSATSPLAGCTSWTPPACPGPSRRILSSSAFSWGPRDTPSRCSAFTSSIRCRPRALRPWSRCKTAWWFSIPNGVSQR